MYERKRQRKKRKKEEKREVKSVQKMTTTDNAKLLIGSKETRELCNMFIICTSSLVRKEKRVGREEGEDGA